MQKFLKNYQLNIIKKTKKDYKTSCARYQNLSEEEKEKEQQLVVNVTKFLRKWKIKACWA